MNHFSRKCLSVFVRAHTLGSALMGGRLSNFNVSGMKRSYSVMDPHNRSAVGANKSELKRANTEPQKIKLSKEEKRRGKFLWPKLGFARDKMSSHRY